MKIDNIIEQIGNIRLDLTYYDGEDAYSDGYIEDVLLEACKNGTAEELLNTSNNFAVLYHLSDIRHNLLDWYSIEETESVLEIGAGCGALTGILSKKAQEVTCVELSKKRSLINAYRNKERENIKILVGNFQQIEPSLGMFDVITLIGVLEYAALYLNSTDNPYTMLLRLVKKHLTKNGRIVIAIENKMGLKYFNGAFEDHTNRQYSGLNDYINNINVRTFSKIELERMIRELGIDNYRFYYPMNDYKFPNTIYSDYIKPKPGSIRCFGDDYQTPHLYNFLDATAWDQITQDGMFPYFSNSFLIDTGGNCSTIFARYNRERKKQFRVKTEIVQELDSVKVIRTPLSAEASVQIKKMAKNGKLWAGTLPDVLCTGLTITEETCIEQYVDGTSLDVDFYYLRNNIDDFLALVRDYTKRYLTPTEDCLIPFALTNEYVNVFGKNYNGNDKSTKYTNVDVCFHNLKRTYDNKVYIFDLEWIFDFPISYRFPIWRSIVNLYCEYQAYLKPFLSRSELLKELGYEDNEQRRYDEMNKKLDEYIYGNNNREIYTERYRKNSFMQTLRIY